MLPKYPYIQRRYVIPTLIAIFTLQFANIFVPHVKLFPKGHQLRFLPSILMVAAVFALVFHMFYRIYQFHKRWKAAGGALCIHCAYDLRGLHNTTACPECGKPLRTPGH